MSWSLWVTAVWYPELHPAGCHALQHPTTSSRLPMNRLGCMTPVCCSQRFFRFGCPSSRPLLQLCLCPRSFPSILNCPFHFLHNQIEWFWIFEDIPVLEFNSFNHCTVSNIFTITKGSPFFVL